MATQTFSGFNVPQKWGQKTNYQGGQGGQLVTHALVTWRAIRPRNGVPPGTIAGQWEQVPDTITSPTQAITPIPGPKPPLPPKPIPISGTRPVNVVNNNVSVSVFQPSGDGAFSGLVPAPPAIAGTALFLREDGTWAAAGGGGGGTVTSVGLALPAEFNVTGSPVTTTGTLTGAWASENNNVVFAGPAVVPGTPTFRSLVFADLPAGVGTVTSIGLSTNASYMTVGSSPVTTAGTITVNKTTGLAANQFVATPSGSTGTADLRAIVPADLAGTPSAGKYWDGAGAGAWTTLPAPGTGTVTSVAMTVPSFLSVAGSPVTTSGTLAVTLATQSANQIFAGPTTGAAATPTFRSMVAADLPNTAVTPGSYTYSSIAVDAQGRLTSASNGAAPTGTVTSVALTVPSILSVSGSPITTSGTLAVTLATQNANLALRGPASGAAATPTFRAPVAEDLASGTATVGYAPISTGVGALPAWGSILGGGAGILQGLDAALPAANTFNFYYATDTKEYYQSDGTNIRYLRTGNSSKCTCASVAGSFSANIFLVSSIGPVAGPLMTNPYTLVVGLYVNSLPGTGGGIIIGYGLGASTKGWYLQNSQTVSNKLALFMKGINSDVPVQLNMTLTTGFHIIALNYNGSTVRYCIDGGTVSSAAATGTFVGPDLNSINKIGGWWNSTGFPVTWADFGFALGIASAVSDGNLQTLSGAGAVAALRPGNIAATYDWYFPAGFIMTGGWGSGTYGPLARGTICNETSGMFLSGNYVITKDR